jgi:sterol desaturase/sphingolipid hydroxylase (fatty acid hydroxylase superfamily)
VELRNLRVETMIPTLVGFATASVILMALFRALERLRPAERRLPMMRAGFWTDAAYWLFTPLATKVVTRVTVIAIIIPVALMAYGKLDRDLIEHGFGPASRLPLWAQAMLIVVLSDFTSYWMHRSFHGRRLWAFHAVHHSSVALDWLSAVRVHPVNDAVMRVAGVLPVVALGFAPVAAAGVAPFLTFMAILIHANLDWDWGPLRGVFASPRFHRWHHTSEEDGRDKNFAGIFPVWDIVFGTYYMPRDRMPDRFGTETPVPPGLWAQLVFPFK